MSDDIEEIEDIEELEEIPSHNNDDHQHKQNDTSVEELKEEEIDEIPTIPDKSEGQNGQHNDKEEDAYFKGIRSALSHTPGLADKLFSALEKASDEVEYRKITDEILKGQKPEVIEAVHEAMAGGADDQKEVIRDALVKAEQPPNVISKIMASYDEISSSEDPLDKVIPKVLQGQTPAVIKSVINVLKKLEGGDTTEEPLKTNRSTVKEVEKKEDVVVEHRQEENAIEEVRCLKQNRDATTLYTP